MEKENTKITIGLVGLPSAGKSSIINSLVGKRLAQSGISRTTLEPKLYENLVSDDNIKFNIYDLPGIADIEDTKDDFDKIIFDTIQKCNIVIWVSDIIKAFITGHELKEFTKIKNYITELASKQGIAIQLLIMLSKVDRTLDESKPKDKSIAFNTISGNTDDTGDAYETGEETEITDTTGEFSGDEDSTVLNIYKNIRDKFKDYDIMCFNAHGRSLYNKKSSRELKKLVERFKPNNVNINFHIKKYFDNIPNINDETKISYFIENFINTKDYYGGCDTNNIGMPSNLILFCATSNILAIDCKNENCPTCTTNKYKFRCKEHKHYLYSNHSNFQIQTQNSTYCTNNQYATHCGTTQCSINWNYHNPNGEILCSHGHNIKKCTVVKYANYQETATKYMEIYNSLILPENKINFVKLILYDSDCLDRDLLTVKKEKYNVDTWNLICKYIKIDFDDNLLSYNDDDYDDTVLTDNQRYRLIQICKKMSIYRKYDLYTLNDLEKSKEIKLIDGSLFKFEKINNIEYLLSQKCFDIIDSKDIANKEHPRNTMNTQYTKQIYDRTLLQRIKQIREQIYDGLEYNISIEMIPIAYKEYGLLWRPIQNNIVDAD